MSKKKTSRVLVAGICISTLLSPVAFEASNGYAAPLEENRAGSWKRIKRVILNRGYFSCRGKVMWKKRARLKQNFNLSANEPTGIYAKPNEEITIEIQGKSPLKLL